VQLARDDPAAAHAVLDEALAGWGRKALDLPRLGHWKGKVETYLYEDRLDEAWDTITSAWSSLVGAGVMRIAVFRHMAENLQARCALARYARGSDLGGRRVAERYVRRWRGSGSAGLSGPALSLDAILSARDGRLEHAVATLELAEQRFAQLQAWQSAAVCRRERGALIGGADGSQLVRAAERRLKRLGARNPARMADRVFRIAAA
jgi:hypothetical protein